MRSAGIGSMIAEINHCGEIILSSTAWKCKGEMTPNSDYTRPGFDFSDWDMAGDAGDNGADPWGQRRDISGEAHWIWSADGLFQLPDFSERGMEKGAHRRGATET